MPLEYSWTREDKPFPKGTTFDLNDRVLNIPNAKFEDGGTYTCTVIKTSGTQNTDTRSFVLTLEGEYHSLLIGLMIRELKTTLFRRRKEVNLKGKNLLQIKCF